MRANYSAKITYMFNAPVSKVWNALINPEEIKKYLFGTQAISDWKVGSPLIFKGEWEGKEYVDKGTILAIEPERLFRYTYWSTFSGKPDIPENYGTVSYELSKIDGFTQLQITQDNIESEDQRKHSEENWKAVLEILKSLVEA